MTTTEPSPAVRLRPIAGAAVVALGVAHALAFMGYMLDDAYVSFRYARNLSEGLGLVYNPGERVEGYTNFSWVVLAAAGIRLGVGPEALIPLLGLACLVGLLVVVVCAGRWLSEQTTHEGDGPAPLAGLYPAAVVAASTGSALYAVSGLELALYCLLITVAALSLIVRRPVSFAFATSLGFLTRPEAGLLGVLGVVVLASDRAAAPRARLRDVARSLAVFTLVVGPYLVFKLSYYGSLWPNTLLAKLPDPREGLDYVLEGCLPLVGLCLCAIVASAGDRRRRLLFLLWLAFTVAAVFEGRDWMYAHRMLVPSLPLLALSAEGVLSGPRVERWLPSRGARLGAALAALSLFVVAQASQTSELLDRTADAQRYDELRVRFARALARSGARSLAMHDIGLVGFVLSDVEIIDLGGLTDRRIARAPGGYGDKRIPAAYLRDREPDVFVLVSSAPSIVRSGRRLLSLRFPVERRLLDDPWFGERYSYVAQHAITSYYHLHEFRLRQRH